MIFCLILIIVNSYLVYSMRSNIGGKILIIAPLLLVQVALLIICFWLKKKKNWKHHQLFLLFSIVLGSLYVFVMPIGAPPDEVHHFRRAYEISEGHFVSQKSDSKDGAGDVLPDSISELFKYDPTQIKYSNYPEIIENSSNTNSESFQSFNNMALYSPVPYIPQTTGILVGRILHLPMIVIFYIARIFNLIFWISLLYFAIKYIPIGKTILCLILLTPVSLQAAASCQADALTTAVSISLIAFVLYKIKNPKLLTKKEKTIAVLLALLISMSKIVYIPLCFLLFALPTKCFNSKKDKIIKVLIVLGVVVVLNLIWLAISSGYLIETNPGVNPSGQVGFILGHPFSYCLVLIRSLFERGMFYFFSFWGSGLGYFNVSLADPYVLSFVFFAFYIFFAEGQKQIKIFLTYQKYVILGIFLTCVLLIFTSIYVQWTAVASSTVVGVQGRYFIPIAILPLLLIPPITKRTRDLSIYAFAAIAAFATYGLVAYMGTYIG